MTPDSFSVHPRPVPSLSPAPSACHIALSRACGSGFGSELAALLRRRLLLVSLIALLPGFIFLVRNLLDPHHRAVIGAVGLGLHIAVTLLQAGLAVVLWQRPCLSLRSLRVMEVILFVAMAGFFSWLQFTGFCAQRFCIRGDDGTYDIARLWINATSLRWFFLIVIYGVFIPNDWNRCALHVLGAALLPLLLTAAGAIHSDRLDEEVLFGLFDMGVLMMTGAAVAIFGAYRLQVLQEQAFEAQQLGQYRLKKKLGEGGMGEVYLAEHVLLRRPCALKMIRGDQLRDPTVLERFEREVKAMATLTHPNTAMVFDYGNAEDGTFYYVMEYLPGLNLETLVARAGPLPPERAIHLIRQVCGAVKEAHSIGLLHRDIKPSNVIVCERGGVHDVAKLLDFGLVQDMAIDHVDSRLTMQGVVLGSPPFLSPEQAAGKTDLDARSDIYGLGGVLYYLLTGRPPFVRETPMEMLLAHAYEAVEPPGQVRDGIDPCLDAVVLRCLAKKRDDRFDNVAQLDEALADCPTAGTWSEEQAAAWWRSTRFEQETGEPLAATQRL